MLSSPTSPTKRMSREARIPRAQRHLAMMKTSAMPRVSSPMPGAQTMPSSFVTGVQSVPAGKTPTVDSLGKEMGTNSITERARMEANEATAPR